LKPVCTTGQILIHSEAAGFGRAGGGPVDSAKPTGWQIGNILMGEGEILTPGMGTLLIPFLLAKRSPDYFYVTMECTVPS